MNRITFVVVTSTIIFIYIFHEIHIDDKKGKEPHTHLEWDLSKMMPTSGSMN